jgi:hypothetical protein
VNIEVEELFVFFMRSFDTLLITSL